MRTINVNLVKEHYSNIANTMKYYYVGIDIFHNRLLTPFEFVERIATNCQTIKDDEIYVMTEEARKKRVLDFDQIKQLIDGTLKFAGNLFFNENSILLCVKFKDKPSNSVVCNLQHKYRDEEFVYSKYFTSIGELMKYVKSLSLHSVKDMYIVPLEATCVRLDKIYGDYFISFLDNYRTHLLRTKVADEYSQNA